MTAPDTIPDRWVTVFWHQGEGTLTAWAVAGTETALEDAYGVYLQCARTRDWLIHFETVMGGRITLPVSALGHWCEMTREAFQRSERIDAAAERLTKEVREEVLGKEWDS